MKRTLCAAVAALGALTTVARGAPLEITCSPGPGTYNVTAVPAPQTDTVLFTGFSGSSAGTAECSVSAAIAQLPAGVVAVYSADYRYDLDPGIGQLVVRNDGHALGVVIQTDDFLVNDVLSDYAGSNAAGNAIDSDIYLALLADGTGTSAFDLRSIEYLELARANLTDIQTSVDQFAANHTSLITHLNATADLLTGAGQKLEQDDGVTALAGLGSFTLGATGRRNLDGGFTLLGGAAVFDQSAGGSTASGLLLSGSLRYIAPGDGFVRPYGEIGLISAPTMGLSFTRSYVTSTGTTTATGSGVGALYGGFVKGGALVAPNADNEIVFAATLAKDWLLTGAYTETLSGSNLFAASAPAQSSSFDTVKVGVDWTTKLVPKTELTLSAALGATIAENAVATNVAFAGVFNGAPKSEGFAEYGARVAYEIDPAQTIGAFIHGSTGQYSGTHVQVGGDFHVRF